MAADGHFAIAWVDSLVVAPGSDPHELYIRFFDKNGVPMTEPYKVAKHEDTNWVYWPCLQMDSSGNAILVWEEIVDTRDDFSDIRFQRFTPDGVPIETAKTLKDSLRLHGWRPFGLGLAPGGRLAVAWSETRKEHQLQYQIYYQRYEVDGTPLDTVFIPHESIADSSFKYFIANAALNDTGDLVVTWVRFRVTSKRFPLFQVFDSDNTSIPGWNPLGHRVDDGIGKHNATRSFPFWLDDDRFVIFWWDAPPIGLLGRVFENRGVTRNPINVVALNNEKAITLGDLKATFSIGVSPDERFAYTYTRLHYHGDDWLHPWVHHAGILGKIIDNAPVRQTGMFEYSRPWGADTVSNMMRTQPPAVGVCNDQIVWVYSRFNPDSIHEAWAVITDWDMVGAEEEPVYASSIQLTATLNRLSYELPGEGNLILYSSAGRKVAEEKIHGRGNWQAVDIPSGVYFARVDSEGYSARAKVVVLR